MEVETQTLMSPSVLPQLDEIVTVEKQRSNDRKMLASYFSICSMEKMVQSANVFMYVLLRVQDKFVHHTSSHKTTGV